MARCPNSDDGEHGFYPGLMKFPWPWFYILPFREKRCLFCGRKK